MIKVTDKSMLPSKSEEISKSEAGAGEANRVERADKSTKDSKKVRLGESGGITF